MNNSNSFCHQTFTFYWIRNTKSFSLLKIFVNDYFTSVKIITIMTLLVFFSAQCNRNFNNALAAR